MRSRHWTAFCASVGERRLGDKIRTYACIVFEIVLNVSYCIIKLYLVHVEGVNTHLCGGVF